jgi:hypothetical protein
MLKPRRALIGTMRLGKDTVFAQTDGGLQIFIPRKGDDGNELDEEIVYDRTYYELALEVTLPSFVLIVILSRSNFFKWVKSAVPGNRTVNGRSDPRGLHRILNLLPPIKRYPLLFLLLI